MAYTSKQRIVAVGTATIYVADRPTGATKISAATWESTGIESLKDSFAITQEAGDTTDINIDQSSAPIYSETQAGKTTVAWRMPNTCKAMWELLYNTLAPTDITAEYGTTPAGKEVLGIQFTTKSISKMVKVDLKTADGMQTYIFPNLQWSSLLTKSGADALGFDITATITAAISSTGADMYVINDMDGTA